MSFFKNPKDPENVAINEKIKEWCKIYLQISSDKLIEIKEIPCWEINCPDVFTKITYKDTKDKEAEIIIRKPLIYVRKVDFMGMGKA